MLIIITLKRWLATKDNLQNPDRINQTTGGQASALRGSLTVGFISGIPVGPVRQTRLPE